MVIKGPRWLRPAVGCLAGGLVAATAVIGPATPADAAAARSAPVYFVHGYNPGSCGKRWNADITAFRHWGWKGRLHTVGYYKADKNCSDHIAGHGVGYGTSINTLGRDLAKYVYKYHSKKHQAVDLVGHSMGGLIVRAALAGVAQHKKGFPPYLYVTNAVTLETPHQGINRHNWPRCKRKGDVQCRQMNSHYTKYYSFVRHLAHGPQTRGGTDWSLVGASDDGVVSWKSGVDLNHAARHKYHYLAGQHLSHSAVREAIGHNHKYRLSYWNAGMSKAKHTKRGWSPVYAAYQACVHPRAW